MRCIQPSSPFSDHSCRVHPLACTPEKAADHHHGATTAPFSRHRRLRAQREGPRPWGMQPAVCRLGRRAVVMKWTRPCADQLQ